jgi:hypothetical protein
MRGAARDSSSSTTLDVPFSGSETITLNFAISVDSPAQYEVEYLSIKDLQWRDLLY